MSSNELRGYPWSQGDDVRVLREFDRVRNEINNALMATNLMISRAESDLVKGRERKKQLLKRFEILQEASEHLYWHRMITWITTGKVL